MVALACVTDLVGHVEAECSFLGSSHMVFFGCLVGLFYWPGLKRNETHSAGGGGGWGWGVGAPTHTCMSP